MQTAAKKRFGGGQPAAGVLPGAASLSDVMAQYVQAQQAVLDKERKRGVLPYKLSDRMKEMGLATLPEEAKPTEEALLRVEALAKVARNEGRKWIGSAEGEDLQVNFRPSWTRTPSLDAFAGGGSIDEKARDAQAAKKQRALHEKVDFLSFANFTGHLLDWGLKMIVTKTLSPVDIISYQLVLCRIAEEYGGVRAAYYYDLLLRQKLAKALQNAPDVDVAAFLNKVDHDTLKDAQAKYESKAKEAGRDNARWRGSTGKGSSSTGEDKSWESASSKRQPSRSPRRHGGKQDNGKGGGPGQRHGFGIRNGHAKGGAKGGNRAQEGGPGRR